MRPEPQFVVFHRAGPAWRRGVAVFEQDGVSGHVGNYRDMLAAGKLLMGGPFLDDEGGGMMIAMKGLDLAELRRFADDDPAVKSGLLTVEVRPWLVGMSAAA